MQEATEEELEKLLDKIMVLFRFIHGKVDLRITTTAVFHCVACGGIIAWLAVGFLYSVWLL